MATQTENINIEYEYPDEFSESVQASIEYHTQKQARWFRLCSSDADDIRQDLIVVALLAAQRHNPAKGAQLDTYVKAAISSHSKNIYRELKSRPTIEQHGVNIRHFEQDLLPPPRASPAIADNIDVHGTIAKLSDRQKMICELIMAGKTRQEIADDIGMCRKSVWLIMKSIKKHFNPM